MGESTPTLLSNIQEIRHHQPQHAEIYFKMDTPTTSQPVDQATGLRETLNHPRHAAVYAILGNAYSKRGQYAEAITSITGLEVESP